jgi:hypothetical protein
VSSTKLAARVEPAVSVTRGAEPPDRVRRVEEPPRHAGVDRRVEPGRRSRLARPDGLVEREHDDVEVMMSPSSHDIRAILPSTWRRKATASSGVASPASAAR